MQIEITKNVPHVEIIEVELPYYYKHNLMIGSGDSIIYGKIEEKTHTSIQETKYYSGEERYEIEQEEHTSIKNMGLSSYFDKKHLSNRREFEEVKNRCLSFLNGC